MTLLAESSTTEDVPPGMHMLVTLDRTGDTKLIWNPANADEVANAKRTFDDLRKKGHVAYAVTDKGKKGEVLTAFDPDVEKMILAPALRGG